MLAAYRIAFLRTRNLFQELRAHFHFECYFHIDIALVLKSIVLLGVFLHFPSMLISK